MWSDPLDPEYKPEPRGPEPMTQGERAFAEALVRLGGGGGVLVGRQDVSTEPRENSNDELSDSARETI